MTRSTKERKGRRVVADIVPALALPTLNRSHVPREEVTTTIANQATSPSITVEKKTGPTIVKTNTVVSPIANQEMKEAVTTKVADVNVMKRASIPKGPNQDISTRKAKIPRKRPKKSVKKESLGKFDSR